MWITTHDVCRGKDRPAPQTNSGFSRDTHCALCDAGHTAKTEKRLTNDAARGLKPDIRCATSALQASAS
jgi:hypothetical protein